MRKFNSTSGSLRSKRDWNSSAMRLAMPRERLTARCHVCIEKDGDLGRTSLWSQLLRSLLKNVPYQVGIDWTIMAISDISIHWYIVYCIYIYIYIYRLYVSCLSLWNARFDQMRRSSWCLSKMFFKVKKRVYLLSSYEPFWDLWFCCCYQDGCWAKLSQSSVRSYEGIAA